jgi:hypothetical protein
LALCLDQNKLETTPVNVFVDMLTVWCFKIDALQPSIHAGYRASIN